MGNSIFLNKALPQKLVLAPGAIIRGKTVYIFPHHAKRSKVCLLILTMEDVVARDDGVPALSDVLLLLVLRPSDVDINLKLKTLYHLHDTVFGSKSAKLTCAQPCKK